MPLWDIKSKSLRFLVNHFIGSFLANTLDEKQIVLLEDGIACLDVYLKIEKLNAMLAEQNIPIVVCIAFISEIIIHSPLSIEINGLDLVIQTTPYNFSKHSDSMINSLISNMTALAVAAANAANGEDDLEGERPRDPSSVALDSHIDPQVEKFVEKLDSFAQKLEQSTNETTTSLIDQTAIERAARFIDSLITGATIIFRDLQLRLQCPLTLSGVHRACDLQLRIHLLEFTNASPSNEPDSASTVPSSERAHKSQTERPRSSEASGEQFKSGRLWSWLWNTRWTSSEERCRDPPSGNAGRTNSDCTFGAIPTILTKNIRMDDVTVHWDLWDTSIASDLQTTCSSAVSLSRSQTSRGSPHSHFLSSSPPAPSTPKGFFIGPTAESMIASACLLTLPMEQNFASVCMRDPGFVSKMLSSNTGDYSVDLPGTVAAVPTPRHPPNQSFGGPTLLDLSIDLGPLIVCACPSELFWLHLMLTQLTSLWEAFAAGRWAVGDDSSSLGKKQSAATGAATVTMTTATVSPRHQRCTSSENILQSLIGAPNEASAHHFIDLDLSGYSPDQRAISPSPSMIDSRMFRTCMNVAEYNEDLQANTGQGGIPFSFSGRCRFFYLLLLLDDEEAATNTSVCVQDHSESELHPRWQRFSSPVISASLSRLGSLEPAPGSPSEADASSEEQFHEALSEFSAVDGDAGGGTNGPCSSLLNSNINHANLSLLTSPAALESIARFFACLRDDLSPRKMVSPAGDLADTLISEISLSLLFNFNEVFRRKKLTARDWVAEVSSRLSEMAAPASHLCLSLGLCQADANFDSPTGAGGGDALNVGGDGGPEALTRRTTLAADTVGVGGELQISAQATGLLLSECLFLPNDSVVDAVVPRIVQLLTFDDFDGSSSSPSVRLHLLTTSASTSQPPFCGFHNCDSSPSHCQSPIRLQLAPCSIDLDPSLFDRIHRLVDALTEAQQVAANIVVTESFSEEDTRVRTWLSAGKHVENSQHAHLSHPAVAADETLCGTQRSVGLQFLLGDENDDDEDDTAADCRDTQTRNQLPASDPCHTDFPLFNILCPSLCIMIRVPIPLEAFKVPPRGSLLQPRTGDAAGSSSPNEWDASGLPLTSSPVWWRPTLRPEYFSVRIEALEASSSNQSVAGRANAAPDIHTASSCPRTQTQRRPMPVTNIASTAPPHHRLHYGDQAFELKFNLLECFLCGPDLESTAFLRLLDRPGTARPSVFVRVAPPGRQHLDDQDLRTCALSHYYRTASPLGSLGDEGVASKQRFGSVDGAASAEVRAENIPPDFQPTHNSRSIEEMEDELLQRVAPKENRRTPFIYKKTFLENDAQGHWDKQTVLPGNADHMAGYCSLATHQSRILVDMYAPLATLNLPSERVVTLIYARVFHDLSLWHSLLPTDRRLRACLRRPRPGAPAATVGDLVADHRYWFLSELAPFVSIYALPQAAAEREARSRHQTSATGTSATIHGRLFDASFDSDDSSFGALSESDSRRKSSHHLRDKNPGDDMYGLRYHQSLLFLNIHFEHVEARTRLAPFLGLDGDAPSTQAVFSARNVRITHELEPSGQVDLKYATVDIQNFDCHILDFFGSKSQQDGASGAHSLKNNIPLLRPFVNPVFPKQTDEDPPTEESMLSIAFESTICAPTTTLGKGNKGASLTTVEELCVSVCLRRACLILWPKLDGWSPQAAASRASPPCWLLRIVDSLSPKMDIAVEYPSFTPPSYSIKQYLHFQEVGVTWPPASAFTFCDDLLPPHNGDSDQPIAPLSDVRPLIVLGETSFYGKVFEPPNSQVNGCAASSLVGFIQNAVFWLISPSPSKRQPRSLRRLFTGPSPSDPTTRQHPVATEVIDFPRSPLIMAEVTDFLDWFAKLNMLEAKHSVRVAELDHAEVRVFTELLPTATTVVDVSTSNRKLSTSSVSQARLDIRLTNNLLRLYTCADTLVALKLLASDLTPATSPASPHSTGRCRSGSSHALPSRPLSTQHSNRLQRRLSEVSRFDYGDSIGELATQSSSIDFTTDAEQTTLISGNSITSLLSDAISDVEPPQSIVHAAPLSPTLTSTSSKPRMKRAPGKRALRSLSNASRVPPASSSTSSDEFVVVTPTPGGRLQDGSHLLQASTPLQHRLCPREGFYANVDGEEEAAEAVTASGPPSHLSLAQDPSTTGSFVTTTRLGGSSRRRNMFSDPASCGSTPPIFALTIFDFSLEWAFYGGSDFLPPFSRGGERKREPSSRLTGSACPPSADSRELRMHPLPGPDAVTSFSEDRFGRPIPSNATPRTGRQFDKSVVVCLTNIYFRNSVFPKSLTPLNDAGSACVSTVADSSLDRQSPTTAPRPPAQQCLPLTRYSLRVADLRIVDRVSSSRVNSLLHARRLGGGGACGTVRPHEVVRASLLFQPTPPSALLLADDQNCCCSRKFRAEPSLYYENFNEDLEAEIKLSVQPLQINLDQNLLIFLCESHAEFTALLKMGLAEFESRISVLDGGPTSNCWTAETVGPQASPPETLEPLNASSPKSSIRQEIADEEMVSRHENQQIFIRKLTFSPALPIRFNYLGRQLDLRQGALVGLLALCLQLNNAELILPRRVYQRGYLGISSLLEEVFADVTSSIQSQLPHVLISSVGPMHEVTNIVHGVWDLVHKSIDALLRHPSDSILTRLGNRDAYVCTRCRSVIQPDQKRTCACSRLGLPLALSNPENFIYGLRSGVRSFSANAIWSTLELSAQSVRVIQSLFETAYDILTPGPSIRHRQVRLRQPADLREGLNNAVHAVVRGVNLITSDFRGVMQGPIGTSVPLNKGSVGALGDMLRQIPPAMVTPLVTGCEATANILGGLRNQMRPEAKLEDEEKWKDTHGL
uniref:Autophagy-related protein 2 n=1 Tax=Schistocephalus solidus TaxID=70667 RepID=A0A0X3NUN8_SCHSO